MPARLFTDLVGGLPAGERVDLEVGRRPRCASGRPLPDAPARHRRRGVPGHPVARRAADDARQPEGAAPGAVARSSSPRPRDEARPILTGVLTRFAGDKLTLAAADNYRIAVKTLPILDPVEDTSLVVPARSYAELMRVLTDTDDPVDIMLASSKSQVLFHVEGVDIVSRLIDGQFPNYQQVLPTSHSTRAVVDRDELLKAVRLSALIASSAANVVRLRLGDEGSGTITIAAAADVGEAQGEVEAAVEGDAVQIAFNARYLQEALQNLDARPARARVLRPALAGRAQADRRRGLRPRDHAGPHAVLTATSRRRLRRARRAPARWPASAATRELGGRVPGRAAGRRRCQRRGQDQPARERCVVLGTGHSHRPRPTAS